jgi:hypothetical protein
MRNVNSVNLAILCVAANMLWIVIGHAESPDFAQLDHRLRAVIKDKNTSDNDLLEAISRLGKLSEPASFWTQIANDPNYSTRHRTRAVFALFRRHGQWSGEMLSLARCIAPAKWLDESSIERVPYVFGYLPVEVTSGESVYSISVLHSSKIYIRLRGEVNQETFVSLLGGRDVTDLKTEPTILQLGYADGYDDWIRNNR